jgi:hypothetical protein
MSEICLHTSDRSREERRQTPWLGQFLDDTHEDIAALADGVHGPDGSVRRAVLPWSPWLGGPISNMRSETVRAPERFDMEARGARVPQSAF